ncbi:MAG: hypothetical protein EH225_01500 [Calditrichaeota bacterium]|nr:ribosomal L7Ae/L30e/S12e/Gadd45 family protein [Calditrichota bacterium]RQV92585.1 MAG: hypothetical protein EH221_11110 [bacterium]RQW07583.1 MAG: hypothetical protein EH225_01500 [Calditrichota bacterium]
MYGKEIHTVNLDIKTETLVGFALKAGQVVRGFDAVRHAAERNSLSLILIKEEISENSEQKLKRTLKNMNIPICKIKKNRDWKLTWGIETHKILGILKGNLGSSIVKNINAGV